MNEEQKEHQKRPVRWHDGIMVPSEAMQGHPEGLWVEVPRRVKRKHKRMYLDALRRRELPEKHEEHLSVEEVDWHIIEYLLEVGVRWNWKDGEGEPLPQPEDDPDVYDEISNFEVIFILEHIEDGTFIRPPKGTG